MFNYRKALGSWVAFLEECPAFHSQCLTADLSISLPLEVHGPIASTEPISTFNGLIRAKGYLGGEEIQRTAVGGRSAIFTVSRSAVFPHSDGLYIAWYCNFQYALIRRLRDVEQGMTQWFSETHSALAQSLVQMSEFRAKRLNLKLRQ